MAKGKLTLKQKCFVDTVADYMHTNHPAWGIDKVMCRPIDAMRLGLSIAVQAKQINKPAAQFTRYLLAQIEKHPTTLDAINEMCRQIMSFRKRGHITMKKN